MTDEQHRPGRRDGRSGAADIGRADMCQADICQAEIREAEWAHLQRHVFALHVRHVAALMPEAPGAVLQPTGKWAEGARALSAITQSIGRLRMIERQGRNDQQQEETDAALSADELRTEIEGRFARLRAASGEPAAE